MISQQAVRFKVLWSPGRSDSRQSLKWLSSPCSQAPGPLCRNGFPHDDLRDGSHEHIHVAIGVVGVSGANAEVEAAGGRGEDAWRVGKVVRKMAASVRR